MAHSFCPACGTARIEGARFCGGCGADLGAPAVPAATVTPGVGPETPPVINVPAPAPLEPWSAPSAAARALAPSGRPRRRIPMVVAVLVLVVAGGIGAYLAFGRGSVTYVGIFSPTGSMSTARWVPSVTLLSDGRVLVAGGSADYSTFLSSAELYDPRTGAFSSTGSMNMARWSNSATLLPDGRVLIAGGDAGTMDSHKALASAELYDPRTGTFDPTGSMTAARDHGHTATLLPDGHVLIAGGTVDGAPSAELYDPRSGTFSPTGSMTTIRDGHTATLLPDGRALIAGGFDSPSGSFDGSSALATAELYDPRSGTFSITGPMSTARLSHYAILLPDGRVLLTAGWTYIPDGRSPTGLSSAELFDPHTGTFSLTGSMSTARIGATTTLLRNGRVLITGGQNGLYGGSERILSSAELYDPVGGTFSPTGPMTTARFATSATQLPDGAILIAGGGGSGGALSSAELFR